MELELLNHYCHDALFEKRHVSYDKDTGVVTVAISREMTEKAERIRKVLFLSKYNVPLVHSTVVFSNVQHAELNIPDIEDNIVRVFIDKTDKVLTIQGVRGSRILLSIDRLDGQVPKLL